MGFLAARGLADLCWRRFRLQDGPRRLPDAPGRPQDSHKTAHGASKTHLDRPKRPQEVAKRPPRPLKSVQDAPKRPPGGPRTASWSRFWHHFGPPETS